MLEALYWLADLAIFTLILLAAVVVEEWLARR